MMNLVSAEYANAEGDAITANLQDGSTKAILQRDSEMWDWITSQTETLIEPYDEPEPDPGTDLERERDGMVVTALQAKTAIYLSTVIGVEGSLTVAVEAAVAAAGGVVEIAWKEASVFERRSPTILALQAVIGLTDAQVDDLFRAAALIDA